MGVFAWIKTNADVIAALASVGSLVVWFVYFGLIYREYRHRQRPTIFIQQTQQSYGLEGSCLLLNMSEQYVDIICVLVVVYTEQGSFTHKVTKHRRISLEEHSQQQVQEMIKEGPLSPGNYISLDSFRELLQDAIHSAPAEFGLSSDLLEQSDTQGIDAFEIRVIAMFSDEQNPIGAVRRFQLVNAEDGTKLRPKHLYTSQLNSRSERRKVREWSETYCLE